MKTSLMLLGTMLLAACDRDLTGPSSIEPNAPAPAAPEGPTPAFFAWPLYDLTDVNGLELQGRCGSGWGLCDLWFPHAKADRLFCRPGVAWLYAYIWIARLGGYGRFTLEWDGTVSVDFVRWRDACPGYLETPSSRAVTINALAVDTTYVDGVWVLGLSEVTVESHFYKIPGLPATEQEPLQITVSEVRVAGNRVYIEVTERDSVGTERTYVLGYKHE